jgi:hypothetical protein
MADYKTDGVFTSGGHFLSNVSKSYCLRPTFVFRITEYSMLSELHAYISLRFAVQTSQRVPQGVLTVVYTSAARRQNTQFLLCVSANYAAFNSPLFNARAYQLVSSSAASAYKNLFLNSTTHKPKTV